MFDHVFSEFRKEHFFILVGLIVNNMERINTRKGTQSTVQCSNIQFYFFYLNVTDPLIIPLVFIFLPCREKAHDSNEFCREN